MNTYNHILLAVDLQPDSVNVGKRAVEIAKAFGAHLTITNVTEPVVLSPASELMIPPDLGIEQELVEKAKSQLEQMRDELDYPDTTVLTLSGPMEHVLIDYADENHVDLIVVGNHHHHALSLLFGTRSDSVLHKANCDLLAVRL